MRILVLLCGCKSYIPRGHSCCGRDIYKHKFFVFCNNRRVHEALIIEPINEFEEIKFWQAGSEDRRNLCCAGNQVPRYIRSPYNVSNEICCPGNVCWAGRGGLVH